MKLYIITDSEGWTTPYVLTSLKGAKNEVKRNFTMAVFADVFWFTISQIDTKLRDVTAQYRIYSDGRENTLFDLDAM